MELAEFKESTQKLCDLYGKPLNETQLEFWYESLKAVDHLTYKIAINRYVKQNKFMPTISDILEQVKTAKRIQGIEEKKEEQKPRVPCEKCHGSGLVKYVKNGYEYLCKCNCPNGKAIDIPQLKTWAEVFRQVDTTMILHYDTSKINF